MSLSQFTPSIVQADFLLQPFIRLTPDHKSVDLFEIKASAIFPVLILVSAHTK